jgi:hypothetical protein
MPGFACSSFVLTGTKSASGGPIHGRNLDYMISDGFVDPDGLVPIELRQNLVVFIVRPERGQAFASVAWPGFVGTVTTMNAAGVSLACLTSTVPRETANATPLLLLYRLIAQYASTLDEAEWLLRGARRTIGNNLTMAAGATNDARRFELSMDRVAAAPPRDGLVLATNHFQHPAMAELQTGWVIPNSLHRLARLGELLGSGGHGIEAAQTVLTDICPPAGVEDAWDCLNNPGTIYSSVAEPARSRLWVRAYDRPDRQWIELDLSEAFAARRVAA